MKGTAAAGAVLALTVAQPLVQKIPGGTLGSIVGGIAIAALGAKMLDGHAEALVVGAGTGIAVAGVLGMFLGRKGA